MGENTRIEWAHHSFNPWSGCQAVSPACDNCYAERFAKRLGVAWGAHADRRFAAETTWKQPLAWNRKAQREGRRDRVFGPSLADPFDKQVPIAWFLVYLDLIRQCEALDFLLLTKRPQLIIRRLHEALEDATPKWDTVRWDTRPVQQWLIRWLNSSPPSNVWLGTTVENREEMLRRAPLLNAVPAVRRFWSAEPLLGDLGVIPREVMPDWIIAGGESGPKARPSHPDWFRSLRDQCQAAGVPFFFKQWGEWRPICQGEGDWYRHLYRSNVLAKEGQDQAALDEAYGQHCIVDKLCLRDDGAHVAITDPGAWQHGTRPVLGFRTGKKAAGALLDGREWREVPA